MKVRTSCICPPIPCRQYDWMAWDDDKYCPCDDPECSCHKSVGNATGYGPTEKEAIEDLYVQIEEGQ